MILTTPIDGVIKLLTVSGYKRCELPLNVANIPFEFSAIFVGAERSLDLVVVIDTLNDHELRNRQKIEGLGRALDLVESKRPLTVILVGPRLNQITLEAMSRICRLLSVEFTTKTPDVSKLREALAVLLPLQLPESAQNAVDPIEELMTRLSDEADNETLHALIKASRQSSEAVRKSFTSIIQSCLEKQQERESI